MTRVFIPSPHFTFIYSGCLVSSHEIALRRKNICYNTNVQQSILAGYSAKPNIGDIKMGIGNLIAWIIVGGVAGWLASIVMKTNASQGLLMDIGVGIVGGFIGGFVLNAIGVGGEVSGLNLVSVLVAFIGAVILLGILRFVRRAR
jgi:uncharacterized membrane protein YeaQ/YmgE (transglycosylase-associated protein family)